MTSHNETLARFRAQIFDPSFITADAAVVFADVHHTHEALALREHVTRLKMRDARMFGIWSFAPDPNHHCNSKCHIVPAPACEQVFECTDPGSHPLARRYADGSVLHRWSGEIYLCWDHGTHHVCTPQLCDHQVTRDGLASCTLTGKDLGSAILATFEIPGMKFESGKAMIAVGASDTNTDALRDRVHAFEASLPHNRQAHEQ